MWRFLLRKTLTSDDDISVVSYIIKIMFYIRCYPNETTMVMICDADAMNVGYSYVQRCQTQSYIQRVTIRYDTIKEFGLES